MKKIFAAAFAVAFAMAALVGCGSSQDETASVETLSLAYLNKASYETIMVADAKGFFDESDVNVELLTVNGSGQQSVEALLAGSVDVAAAGQGPAADALGQYDNIVVICGTNCSTDTQVWVAGPVLTGDAALVSYDQAADNAAEVAASFEAAATALGHPVRVGVQQGSTTEASFKLWLSAMGIAYNDYATEGDAPVSLIDVQANTLPTVMATGEDIDMMAASQPFPSTTLMSIEGSYQVGSNADTNSYDVAIYITTQEIYQAKEASIKAFVAALDATTTYMADEANEAECVTICASTMGADEATVQAAFNVADWNTAMTEKMLESVFEASQKKGHDTTYDEIMAACPLIEWMETELA